MSEIIVQYYNQEIVVDPATQAVSVINAGPQGPPGIDGGTAATYEHIQTMASTSWVINHNLGFKPNIDAYDESDRPMDVYIIHHSLVQAEIQTLTPRAGKARAS